MLLTITTSGERATDLGFLLHKHPDRVQTFNESVGIVHVFYPEAADDACTVAMMLEVDSIGLVRNRRFGSDGFSLAQYVNDRPYAASSMLAVALGRVFKSALAGRCDARPELIDREWPLRICIPALPCAGGADVARRVFEPLGWEVNASAVPLDHTLPQWGPSRYVELELTGRQRLADALSHLYVLMPVLDDAKHYWVGTEEIDKLMRTASGWLHAHPERDMITRRYLAHQRSLVRTAADRLSEMDEFADDDDVSAEEAPTSARASLAVERRGAVLAQLRELKAKSVADVGCGEGALLAELLKVPTFTQIVGADVSARALSRAERRLHVDRLSDRQAERLDLWHSSLMYRDQRLSGFDAIVLMEVIEHVEQDRLSTLERSVFGAARPRSIIVTTPNAEYNVRFPTLAAGRFRHSDHRFEWTREQFQAWASRVADVYRYQVSYYPVGDDDQEVGSPTQMAVFTV